MNNLIKYMKIHSKEISILIFITVLIVMMVPLFSTGFDYWWHLKTGEYIASTGGIPTSDIFSWYGVTQGLPWISHEWLSEIVLVVFKFIFGYNHVFFYILIFIAVTFFCLYLFLRKEMNKNVLATLLFFVVGIFLLGPTLTPRPHLISNLLFLISLFFVFDLYKNENSKKIYILPIITILWGNLHGGSSNLTYLLCFFFYVFGLLNFKFLGISAKRISSKQLKKFLMVGILCMVAICMNPHGIQMLLYPYHNMQDVFMKSVISEWRMSSIFRVSDLPFFLLSIISFIILFFIKKKRLFIPLALLFIFFILAISSMRFIPYFYLVSAFALFQNVDSCRESKYLPLLLIGASIFVLLIGNINFNKTTSSLQEPLLPDSVISYLEISSPRRLLNYYDYGGYLIYKDMGVFVDGRADVYSKHNLRDYQELMDAGRRTGFLLEYYQFDYILIPNSVALYALLNEDNSYQRVLEEGNIMLYKKVIE